MPRKIGESAAPSPHSDPSAPPTVPAPPASKADRKMMLEGASGEPQHARFPSSSVSDPAKVRAFAIDAARMLADDKCEEVVVLDVRNLSQISDYIVIGSGTSDRQMHSSAQDVKEMAQKIGHSVFRMSEDARTTWIILDCVDVVVHVFEPATRAHYDLEMLWGDAERVEWERPDQKNRDRAGLGG